MKNSTLFRRIAIVALAIACVVCLFACTQPTPEEKDLYKDAVADAMTASPDEIVPLVTLTPDSSMVTWNEEGSKVLMLSWHKYPDSYKAGESFTCAYGEVWVFTDKEILSWYDENGKDVTDWEVRLEQLIGLPAEKEYTHVSAFWVDIEEMIRPAYQPDVTKQVTKEDLDSSALGEYRDWFDGNAEYSYTSETPYPWTRLGYTYDWADNCDDYGLTEFIILPDSVIEVEWTKTTAEFVTWMSEN